MTAAYDTLTALDWTAVACQCHKHACAGTAKFIVETHAVSHCNDADLTPFGNQVRLLCEPCLQRTRQVIAWEVAQLVGSARGPVMCETCGVPIAAPSDVLRAVEPLYV
jgi:hypothetical protein